MKMLAQKNILHFLVLGFKVETFSLHLTKYVNRYSMKLNLLGLIFISVLFVFSLTKTF